MDVLITVFLFLTLLAMLAAEDRKGNGKYDHNCKKPKATKHNCGKVWNCGKCKARWKYKVRISEPKGHRYYYTERIEK